MDPRPVDRADSRLVVDRKDLNVTLALVNAVTELTAAVVALNATIKADTNARATGR